jgi:chromate reductase, NAD(P)H dehydrogenase (quinone)
MRLLAVCGSLQAESANLRLLHAAARLTPAGATLELFDGVRDLPAFNADLEESAPPAVVRWREALAGADGIFIASPEYAHGMPGALKNGIDWVVGSGELVGKVVAITAASPAAYRGRLGLEALASALGAVSAVVVGGEPIAPGPQFEAQIEALVVALCDRVRALPTP